MSTAQMQPTQQTTSLFKAMVKAQADFDKIDRTRSGYNYKYAPLDVVRNAVVPTLKKHGLTVIQFPINGDDHIGDTTTVGVETILAHESGESISRTFTTRLLKQDPQSVGSAITYYRRYALLACLGLAPEDEDNDASDHAHTQQRAHEASREVDPADYIMPIGKFKGEKLGSLDLDALTSWAKFMMNKGDLNGPAKEALATIKLYLQDVGR